jgi:glycosyltransferase involved in cell wall biosynthesis
VYGRLATILKWPGKTDTLIRLAGVVLAGNESVARHVQSLGAEAVVLPTIVDLRVFKPRHEPRDIPVIGWLGSHTTFAYLERLLPVLSALAAHNRFRVRIIGSGRESVPLHGVDVEVRPWSLETEVDDYRSLDVGLYPLGEDEWAQSKSGLKAVQYMAVGVPFVMTPAGICASMGVDGVTHFLARTDDEWCAGLERLLRDPALRKTMGDAGRAWAESHFAMDPHADRLAEVLQAAR